MSCIILYVRNMFPKSVFRIITFPKVVCFGFQKELFFGKIKTCRALFCMVEIWNVSDFSNQCFEYQISDMVSEKLFDFVMTLCLKANCYNTRAPDLDDRFIFRQMPLNSQLFYRELMLRIGMENTSQWLQMNQNEYNPITGCRP